MRHVPPVPSEPRPILVRPILRATLFAICAILVVSAGGCAKRTLRGKAVHSRDGKTYLIVDDDNSGLCGPIEIDNRQWSHPLHAAGEIAAGLHRISCGHATVIEFSVDPGTTFHFDYWGP